MALKLWPTGHEKSAHNYLVVEIGLILCGHHVQEAALQGRSFFMFEPEYRAAINDLCKGQGLADPDWETAELYAIPTDGSTVIDTTSSSPYLPPENPLAN